MSTLQTIPNTQLTNLSKTITSIELVELINKHRAENNVTTELTHANFLKKLRNEIDAGILAEVNISLGEYLDSNNQKRPMYQLDKEASIYMVSGEIGQVRMAIIRRWTELETVVQAVADTLQVDKEALIKSLKQDTTIKKLQASISASDAKIEASNLKLEALRTKHKQTMAILEAKTTKLLSQGAKVKGDLSVGKVIMPRSTITHLLRSNHCVTQPSDANYALVLLGYLDSSRKLVTSTGSLYGLSNKAGNGNASQALWFDSEFPELYKQIEHKLIEVGILDTNGKYFPKDTE